MFFLARHRRNRSLIILGVLLLPIGCGGKNSPPPITKENTHSEKSANNPKGTSDRVDVLKNTTNPTATPIRFRDVVASSGISWRNTSGRDPERSYPTANGTSIGVWDYDGDGWLDLYLVDGCKFPLQTTPERPGGVVCRNRGDLTFENVSARCGLNFPFFGQGFCASDYNNDGFADAYLTGYGGNRLFQNQGDGTFVESTRAAGVSDERWGTGVAFLDFDRDGNLDFYRAHYADWSPENSPWCGDRNRNIRIYCRPTVLTPLAHRLYRSRGDGTFADVTQSAGVARTDGRGMGVLAVDVNDDGHIDLCVANDMSPNFLFINKSDGTFNDPRELSGFTANRFGALQADMGIDAADFDGDGRLDIITTTYYYEAATLYRNDGQGFFTDVSDSCGLGRTKPAVKWGVGLIDFDNDTWPDLFITNGHTEDNLRLLNQDQDFEEHPMLYRNHQGRFESLDAAAGPYFSAKFAGRGCAFGDLNNDGRIDIVVNHLEKAPGILVNESPAPPNRPAASWIRLQLVGRRANRDAIGSIVEVTLGSRRLIHQLKGGGSFMSSNDLRLHLGLGAADTIDRLVIRWPGGAQSTLENLSTRREYLLLEPW